MALPTLGLPVVQSMEMFQHAGCYCDVQCATLDSNRKIYLVQLISNKMKKTCITCRDLRSYYGELHSGSCMALPTLGLAVVYNKMNKTCITYRDLRPYYGELHATTMAIVFHCPVCGRRATPCAPSQTGFAARVLLPVSQLRPTCQSIPRIHTNHI